MSNNLPTPAPQQVVPATPPQPVEVKANVSTINTKAKKKTFVFPNLGKSVQAGSQEEANLEITKTEEYKNFIKN